MMRELKQQLMADDVMCTATSQELDINKRRFKIKMCFNNTFINNYVADLFIFFWY